MPTALTCFAHIASSVVTFTFDLGDGPVVLTVRSPMHLNDRQWHYIRAERNVKESSLQVDLLPLQLIEAAAEGQHTLQLSGQLFVGKELTCFFKPTATLLLILKKDALQKPCIYCLLLCSKM